MHATCKGTSCNIVACIPCGTMLQDVGWCWIKFQNVQSFFATFWTLQDVVCVWPGIWNVFNKDFLTSVYSWRNLNRKSNHLIKLFANLCVQRSSPVVSIYLMTRREVKIAGYWPSSFPRFYRPNQSRWPQRRKKNKTKKNYYPGILAEQACEWNN